jgi:hypothetical protein
MILLKRNNHGDPKKIKDTGNESPRERKEATRIKNRIIKSQS